MKRKETILVIESERIVSMEIKMELELKGYSVAQSGFLSQLQELKERPVFKAIIIDIDNLDKKDFEFMKQNFNLSETAVIAISSDLSENEHEGVKFVQTFLKPIDCKSIASLVDSNFTALKYH